jgi:S1-C subfamily serine protease
MNGQNIDSLLADAAERIKREAYAAGWRDAVAAINKAVGELVDPAALEDVEVRDAAGTPAAIGSTRAANSRLPKQGSTPWEVIQAVKKRPGMTATQIVEALHEGGHGAPENSVRTSIFRMKSKKLIVSRHNKWYAA